MSAIAERLAGRVLGRAQDVPLVVITPWRPGVLPRLVELWWFRSTIPYLWKEFILARYRRTYLSWLWIPLRPGIDIASRTLLFGGFLQVGSGDRPYFIYIAFASAGWTMFEGTLKWGTRAVQRGNSIVRGLHFPRSVLLAGALAPAAMDFVLYSGVAIVGTIYYLLVQQHNYLAPPPQMVVGVLGLALLMLFGLALSLFTAPLAMITKEIRYLLGFVTQFWYFVTPVVYAISTLPPKYRLIAEANPITAPIEMVKFGFLSTAPPETISLFTCFVGLFVLLATGLWFFSRCEHAAVQRL
jgi:lipopolysaccharide transport system permease protein